MANIGIIQGNISDSSEEAEEREIFERYISRRGHYVSCFVSSNVRNNVASEVLKLGGGSQYNAPLKNFDLVYLSSLGPIREKSKDLTGFISELSELERTIVLNDPRTMLNNFSKEYLIKLQEQGIRTVPTIDATKMDMEEIRELNFTKYNSEDIIIKPMDFGERGNGIVRLSEIENTELESLKLKYGKRIIAQPFLSGIINGERSVVFVGEKPTHGMYRTRKVWNDNPERIMIQLDPTPEEIQEGLKSIKAWPTPTHITRVDFITQDGMPHVSEVEMINPNLWLTRSNCGRDFMAQFVPYLESLL